MSSRENFRIVIVDDERSFLLLMTRILEDAGYSVRGYADPEEALKAINSMSPNLVISDLKMPKMDGIRFMEEARKISDADFIVITAFATVETAVAAMKKGAADYITKPLKDPDQLRIAVAKIFDRQCLLSENALLRSSVFGDIPSLDIAFAGMDDVLRTIMDVAPTDATVMLYGETGTGKTLVAKVLHRLSGRPGPFVEINCAAIPENLLESELFGHERGAFTGALQQKKGKFEFASGGSIMLDEVSEMSIALQAKLLKVLQDKTFERLGSLNTLKTDARVIAATNRDLKQMVSDGKFREDLYYRLNVFPVAIPPLRERKSHMKEIVRYLAVSIAGRLGKEERTVSETAMDSLMKYPWPGNIRELENVIERAIIISRGSELQIPDIDGLCGLRPEKSGADLKSLEKEAIKKALSRTAGNRRKAAEMLGISLRSLQYKIKEYGSN
ncbi:MAG TPA: sigma-54 dependent transcriptional regulator [Dissulfurispiraceae bacterium]|nr:sigma-54 dependent transcriptional regulator [Dissulfurispiraceae bacterium]